MICTIAKRLAKWFKFLNPDPFTKRESVVSNFHTNLYGAIQSHNITAQSAPDFGHALFNPPEPLEFLSAFLIIYVPNNLYLTLILIKGTVQARSQDFSNGGAHTKHDFA